MELMTTASLMGIRESRRIVGDYELNFADYLARRQFPDQIGVFNKHVDIHTYDTSEAEYQRLMEEITHLCPTIFLPPPARLWHYRTHAQRDHDPARAPACSAHPQEARPRANGLLGHGRGNLRILGAGGGYILGPCHNIQAVSPPENIVAMYEAGYELGWTTAST